MRFLPEQTFDDIDCPSNGGLDFGADVKYLPGAAVAVVQYGEQAVNGIADEGKVALAV